MRHRKTDLLVVPSVAQSGIWMATFYEIFISPDRRFLARAAGWPAHWIGKEGSWDQR